MLDLKNKGKPLMLKSALGTVQNQPMDSKHINQVKRAVDMDPIIQQKSVFPKNINKQQTFSDQILKTNNLDKKVRINKSANSDMKDARSIKETIDTNENKDSKLGEYFKNLPSRTKLPANKNVGRILQKNQHTHRYDEEDKSSPTYTTESHKARHLNGFFPWEKQGIFTKILEVWFCILILIQLID